MPNLFMARAIELSIENVRTGRGGPFGAVVVKDGKMIAEAANNVTGTNDPTAHAEILAIREACRKLDAFELTGCEIYTSRPDRVYYGNTAADAAKVGFDDSFIYDEIPLPLDQRKIPMVQMMPDEAIEGFRAWEKQANKVPY
jgi:tRNA(Arg) A34 adenosine deaminase TadA